MRFIDANVFIYALLKPPHAVSAEVQKIKNSAQNILVRVENGEKTFTSVVHFSEFVNVLGRHISITQQCAILESILLRENIEIVSVTREMYALAIELSKDTKLGINDALAVVLMQQKQVSEIYSFDKDFDSLDEITRLTH